MKPDRITSLTTLLIVVDQTMIYTHAVNRKFTHSIL
jgi:hypothetical protein